jgi:pimeloyl-ACP methyl ester carboxylesterase
VRIVQTEHDGVGTFRQPDGYPTHFRVWGPEAAADRVVILHGGMSHSGWQAPLADRITGLADDTAFVAVDLRGSGLNEGHGHIPGGEVAVGDVVRLLESFRTANPAARIHLAGWCFGAQVATVAAARLASRATLSSLVMICPGFFFTERYEDVLDRSVDAALAVVDALGLNVEPERPFIRIPLRPKDFTDRPEWLEAIAEDQLKLTHVTVGTIDSWEEIAAWSEKDYAGLGPVPVRAVFGRRDRLVDNDRVAGFLSSHPDVEIHELDAGHAVQFEQPDALARFVTDVVARARP